MDTFKFTDHKIAGCEIDVVDQLQKINLAAMRCLTFLCGGTGAMTKRCRYSNLRFGKFGPGKAEIPRK